MSLALDCLLNSDMSDTANPTKAETSHPQLAKNLTWFSRRFMVDSSRCPIAYDVMAQRNPAYQNILLRLLAVAGDWNLKPGDRVLDLGAGTGNCSLALAAAFPDVVVTHLDRDERACERARRKRDQARLSNLEIIAADMRGVEFRHQTFAGVVAVHSLNCLTNPASMIAQMSWWLKPGGHVFACSENRPRKCGDWSDYIFRETHTRDGLLAVYKLIWDARRGIVRTDREGTLAATETCGTASRERFLAAFEDYGLTVERGLILYRGSSDAVIARKVRSHGAVVSL